ncbi:hypothetical protein [Mangrovicella endophytica]|uniref:hypothetical protein n=1 Tax=Mangrovicella endophytica TaxID=2066697 RepID=UPI000C9DD804|nr:hypothetical protein [Mangrovicella endophytica]
MSDHDTAIVSHTLAYLRKIDKRLDETDRHLIQVIDLLSRQQTRLDRIERDGREIRNDMAVMENNILNRMTGTMRMKR